MSSSSSKDSTSFYLSASLINEIDAAATSSGSSRSQVVNEILSEHFKRGDSASNIELFSQQLRRVASSQRAVAMDLEVLGELIGSYIFFWFCHTPAIPESNRSALTADARLRFGKFLDFIKKNRSKGKSLLEPMLAAIEDSMQQIEGRTDQSGKNIELES